jgi:enoyl-CoA hydratase/carnithine racemase
VAAASAKFADTHARWALTPVWGMSQRLPRRVGLAKAQEMTCTARTYSGAEAQAMGLVNWCVPDEAFDGELDRFTKSILANSWFSLRANKRLYRETDGLPLRAGLSHEIARTEGRGPDMDARIAAFMNKTSKLS